MAEETKRKKLHKVTVYRDDSRTPVVYENVKHVFWSAGNTVLVVAVVDDIETGAHHYEEWLREHVTRYRVDKLEAADTSPPEASISATFYVEDTGEATTLPHGAPDAKRFNVYDSWPNFYGRQNGVNTMQLDSLLRDSKPGMLFCITVAPIPLPSE